MAWTFAAVVVAASLFLSLAFEAVARGNLQIYPAWLKELHVVFFWFSMTFRTLNHTWREMAERGEHMRERKDLMGWLFILQAAAALALRFGAGLDIITSYAGSFFLLGVAPLYGADWILPVLAKRGQSVRMAASRVRALAANTAAARGFLRRFPEAQAFVYGNTRESQTAACVFHRRFECRGREDLFQDAVLTVPVDMRKAAADESGIRFDHYWLINGEEASSVVHPPKAYDMEDFDEDEPPSADLVAKIESMPPRYPLLRDVPLEIANRGGKYTKVG